MRDSNYVCVALSVSVLFIFAGIILPDNYLVGIGVVVFLDGIFRLRKALQKFEKTIEKGEKRSG